jgi:hypothetical protein
VRNENRGAVLGDAITVADTSATRNVGLLKHTGLNANEGLWIVPCQSVHTFFMKFAIDLVWLDKRRLVRKVRHAVPAWRISGCLWAHSVLELPAGSVVDTKTQPGDQLTIE